MSFHRAWEAKVNAVQNACYRKAMRIPTTYASKRMGTEAVRNVEVLQRARAAPLSVSMGKSRFILLEAF